MAKKPKAAKLRFASFIRVSTEKQKKKGESLRTQEESNIRSVKILGGEIVATYGGQEHATPDWEKEQLNLMMTHAEAGRFDAIIVYNVKRWSRDNESSKKHIRTLRRVGVRFFVGCEEFDLDDAERRLYLGLSTEFNEYDATQQAKTSIDNRIARARQGYPTVGKLPFGRTYDKELKKWGIDKKGKKQMEDVAKRYLRGESLGKLADEYGVNHSTLHKNLMDRCGDIWIQRFDFPAYNIHEEIPTPVPRLLPQEIIEKVHKKRDGNKTFDRKLGKGEKYLLSRFVFCSHCGYAMMSQKNGHGGRHYRHASRTECTRPGVKAWVNADDLERDVFRKIYNSIGSEVEARKVIEAANPPMGDEKELVESRKRLTKKLTELDETISVLTDLLLKKQIERSKYDIRLEGYRKKEAELKQSLSEVQIRIDQRLTSLKAAQSLPAYKKKLERRLAGKPERASARGMYGEFPERPIEEISFEEKRELLCNVFNGKLPDGRRMGVRIGWIDGEEENHRKRWSFTIDGHFIIEQGITPADEQTPMTAEEEAEWYTDPDWNDRSPKKSRPKKNVEKQSKKRSPRVVSHSGKY